MLYTEGNFYDGSQVKGTYSILPGDCIGDGPGSLEVAGAFYTNKIQQYNNLNTVGVTIEMSNFYGGNLIVPSGITTGNINFTGDLYQNSKLYVGSQWSGTNGNFLYYGSTGNILVGIGTTNPGYTLDINGPLNFNGELYQNNVPYVGSQWTGTNGNFLFYGSTGNVLVGIGTTNPAYTLDINGNLYIRSTTPSDNTSRGSLITLGGISINNTTDANSFTSGGGLTIAGGASINKTLYANIIINNNALITNLTSNTALITNLTSKTALITNLTSNTALITNLTTNNALITNLTSNSALITNLTSNSALITNLTSNYIDGTNASFLNATIGTLHVSNQLVYTDNITNLSSENVNVVNITTSTINVNLGITSGSLYVNKDTILNGNVNINNTTPSYNSSTGALTLTGGLSINTTENAINVSSGGGITIAGGLSVARDLYVGGKSFLYKNLNLNNNSIINVTSPSNLLDVANKYYVDSYFGNLSQGQVVVTGSNGSSVTSFNSFTFDGTLLSINSTNLATSLSSGGTFITYGGASIQGNLIVGSGIDANNHYITNVATPIYPGDAVNKKYIDDMFHNCDFHGTNYDDLFEHTQIIDIQTSMLLPELSYDSNDIKAFIAYVYVRIVGLTMGLYTIKGFYNGTQWIIISQSIGNYTSMQFSITTNGGIGTIQCINPSTSNSIYVKYRKYYELKTSDTNLLTLQLVNTNTPIDVNNLNYNNNTVVGFKTAIIIKSLTKSALFLLTGLQKNGVWLVSYYFFGDQNTGVTLSITNSGQIQYTNENPVNTCVLEAENIIVLGSQFNLTLLANTTVYTPLPQIKFNINQTSNFTLTIYVQVNNLYAIMEINALVVFNDYSVNIVYSGDNTNVQFRIINGILHYTNLNNFDAIIKYNVNLAPYSNPLCVGKGGTGNSDLLPYSILRGMGQNPIVGTDDLIYQNKQLKLTDSTLYINNTENISGTNGGTIITNGGVNIKKSVYIGQDLNINKGSLLYTNGTLLLNNNNTGASLITLGKVYINDTTNSTGSSGSLVLLGGMSIKKDLFVNGNVSINGTTNMYNILDMNNNLIKNVPVPILGTDAVNKDYVDFVSTKISGDFTHGQVIIGDSTGSTIKGYTNLLFDGTTLTLSQANLLITGSNGNSFKTYGGAFIVGELDVNSQNIKNVKTPIIGSDAVNKMYVDNLFHSCDYYGTNYDELFEHSKIVQVNTSALLNSLSFDSTTVLAFTIFAYVQLDASMSLYILKGFYNGTNWILNSQSVGSNYNILFFITTDSLGVGYINCYNPARNSIYVKYRLYYEVNVTDSDVQTILLNNNVSIPTNVPGLQFDNTLVIAFKTTILVSTSTKSALYLLTGLQKNGVWIMNCNWFGDITNVNLSIVSNTTNGTVQYTNSNTSGNVHMCIKDFVILDKNQANIVLLANTSVNTSIPELTFDANQTSNFFLTLYIEIDSLYAIMEIYGVVINGVYSINTQFSGDNTGIKFYISNSGTILYTNPNGFNANIKYAANTPPYLNPLCVKKGGTGVTDLLPYSILRGMGQNSIVGTSDLIYQNNQLKLTDSTLYINNTENILGTSGGTLITNGGVNIKKDMYIGGDLYMKISKISENVFIGNNGVNIPANITNFNFSNVNYFTAIVSIIKNTSTSSLCSGFDIRGIQLVSGWEITSNDIGDETGIHFNITNSGQIQYTSNSIGNWLSTTIKFKTTSI